MKPPAKVTCTVVCKYIIAESDMIKTQFTCTLA